MDVSHTSSYTTFQPSGALCKPYYVSTVRRWRLRLTVTLGQDGSGVLGNCIVVRRDFLFFFTLDMIRWIRSDLSDSSTLCISIIWKWGERGRILKGEREQGNRKGKSYLQTTCGWAPSITNPKHDPYTDVCSVLQGPEYLVDKILSTVGITPFLYYRILVKSMTIGWYSHFSCLPVTLTRRPTPHENFQGDS